MQVDIKDWINTVEEYIEHELKYAVRSEFVNVQLFEMAGEQDINNEIAENLYILFSMVLKSFRYFIYNHDVKVKIFGENKYYYPDVFITKELKTDSNKYIKSEPVLIAEVVSENLQINDYVDKYIAYTKIPSLKYYLIIEPETAWITWYKKSEIGEWITSKFTRSKEVIHLDAIKHLLQIKQVYS